MRIHFFVRTLNDKTGGGSHYNSILFIHGLQKAGHTVVVHLLYGQSGDNNPPDDLEIIRHPGFGLSFRGERAYLADLLKEYEKDADAFFLYAVEFTWGGGLYRKRGGKKPVVVYMDAYLASMRRSHAQNLRMHWYQFKRLPWDKTVGLSDARHIDRFMPVSKYIGDVYKKFGFPENRFTILPSIVPPPPSTSVPVEKKNEGSVSILYVGRLIYEKGVDLLIDALEDLKELPWKLVIVGDGERRSEIEAKALASGLPIDIRGWVTREEVWEAYRNADVFVHPARWADPGPRSINDALWCDLPVVVPDTGGSAWIAGEAGVVFKTGDKASLTEALRRLITDKDLRQRLAAHAHAEAIRFEESVVYPQLEQILRSVTSPAR